MFSITIEIKQRPRFGKILIGFYKYADYNTTFSRQARIQINSSEVEGGVNRVVRRPIYQSI
jgi:hypothetical protein